MSRDHIHFVTGKLAHGALQRMLANLAPQVGFAYSVDVLPITVAALMTPAWIARHIQVPPPATSVLLPGYCGGDLSPLTERLSILVEVGPRDLHELPRYFSQPALPANYGDYDIEVIAEINHCPRLSLDEIVAIADGYARDGADVIDLGCDPGWTWSGIADGVAALRDRGYRVSVDSFNSQEISWAVGAGAELVLSVNGSNREGAADWGAEVVAIPDDPATLGGLADTVQWLQSRGVRYRIDPVLEPIGVGFAESIGRYIDIRRQYPDAELLMGIGNLTELTDCDSAGVNVLLIGFCQELGIRSVLTTQVINWARTSVKECDMARRLMHEAVTQRRLPKHIEPQLIMLRDELVAGPTSDEIAALAEEIRDNNYRIFVADNRIHLVSGGMHMEGDDPFEIMARLQTAGPSGTVPKNLDAGHAFYLGYEMAKASAALTLGKNYVQDEALDWGLATRPEARHYLKRGGPAE